MVEFQIRVATSADAPEIRALIRAAQINPLGLDWRRFVVAVSAGDLVMGCGQVKPHGEGVRELASIAVWPQYRGQGIARAIIEHLLSLNPGPLYLMCRSPLGILYEKFGFRELRQVEMPSYYRRIARLVGLLTKISKDDHYLMVMKRD